MASAEVRKSSERRERTIHVRWIGGNCDQSSLDQAVAQLLPIPDGFVRTKLEVTSKESTVGLHAQLPYSTIEVVDEIFS